MITDQRDQDCQPENWRKLLAGGRRAGGRCRLQMWGWSSEAAGSYQQMLESWKAVTRYGKVCSALVSYDLLLHRSIPYVYYTYNTTIAIWIYLEDFISQS